MAKSLREITFFLALFCSTIAVALNMDVSSSIWLENELIDTTDGLVYNLNDEIAPQMKGTPMHQDLFPIWIDQTADKDLWLGVSPPTEDKIAARNMAVQNAILYYLCANGGGSLQSAYSYNEELQHKLQDVTLKEELVERTSYEAIAVSFEQFSTHIVHEYHNKYGECFVACKINPDKSSENVVKILRDWSEKEDESGNLRFDIASNINGHNMLCSLAVTYNDYGISYMLKSDDIVISDFRNWEYPSLQLSSSQSTYGYKFTTNQSLGVSQMACLAMLPFVADTMNVEGIAMSTLAFEEGLEIQTTSSSTRIKANGKNRGLGFTLHGIKQNTLDVRVEDFSEDSISEGCLLIGIGCSYPARNSPLSLSKLKAFYRALYVVAKNHISNSITENRIPTHNIDWCFGKNQETNMHRVKIMLKMENDLKK